MPSSIMYQKEFDGWIEKKKQLNKITRPVQYHEGEIWWCSLGVNVGFEQDGKGPNFDRPVIIIKGFNWNLLYVVALIGRKKEGRYFHYLGKIGDRDSTAVLSQVKILDARRLIKRMKVLDADSFLELKSKIRDTLFGRTIFCPCVCRGGPEGISLPLHRAKEGSEDLGKS